MIMAYEFRDGVTFLSMRVNSTSGIIYSVNGGNEMFTDLPPKHVDFLAGHASPSHKRSRKVERVSQQSCRPSNNESFGKMSPGVHCATSRSNLLPV